MTVVGFFSAALQPDIQSRGVSKPKRVIPRVCIQIPLLRVICTVRRYEDRVELGDDLVLPFWPERGIVFDTTKEIDLFLPRHITGDLEYLRNAPNGQWSPPSRKRHSTTPWAGLAGAAEVGALGEGAPSG